MKKIILLLFILYILIVKPAFAQSLPQQFVTVSPIIEDLNLIPGTHISYPLTLTNKGDKPVGFHVDLSDADPTAEGNTISMSHTSEFLRWIKISPTDLIVPPHETEIFTVIITTPKDAPHSGYFATLFLTPFISNPTTSGPIVLERIGALLLGTVGTPNYEDLSKKVHISSFSFVHGLFSLPKELEFEVQNNYFAHFSAKPFLTYSPFFGKTITVTPVEKHVLPGRSRNWNYQIELPWYMPYAKAHLAVSVGQGYQVVADTWYLNYPLLGIILASIFVLLILTKRTRQLKKVFLILVFGRI